MRPSVRLTAASAAVAGLVAVSTACRMCRYPKRGGSSDDSALPSGGWRSAPRPRRPSPPRSESWPVSRRRRPSPTAAASTCRSSPRAYPWTPVPRRWHRPHQRRCAESGTADRLQRHPGLFVERPLRTRQRRGSQPEHQGSAEPVARVGPGGPDARSRRRRAAGSAGGAASAGTRLNGSVKRQSDASAGGSASGGVTTSAAISTSCGGVSRSGGITLGGTSFEQTGTCDG